MDPCIGLLAQASLLKGGMPPINQARGCLAPALPPSCEPE